MNPEQIPGTVESVPLTWVMQNLRGFVDDFEDQGNEYAAWRYIFLEKLGDSSTAALVNRFLNHGMTTPICLYGASSYISGWMLGNGHHRLVAALLTGLDNILVYWAKSGEGYMCDHVTTAEGTDTYGWWDELTEEEQGIAKHLGEVYEDFYSTP